MDENQKYEVIKKLVDTNGNKKTAALKIGCSDRHINRLIKGYQEQGKSFFIHGNRGRQPAITLPTDTKQLILDLYRTKYSDCNLTHYSELLKEKEHISVSVSAITSILRKEYILSPKANRSSKKAVKKALKAIQSKTKSKKKAAIIQSSIMDLEDSHPRHPRCAYFGEMLQMDASLHLWFGQFKTQLHIAVDDATGQIVGAYFDEQETLNGYYHVLYQVLSNYGIPYQFFTDNRTVFEYKKKHETSLEKDTFTQFGYACKQLGIDIRTSSVAQAKGRVERMFGTLQSRLPVELRLANVTSIQQANQFLHTYIKKFNKQFALPIDSIKSVFEMQPDSDKINLTLAVLSSRKIDNGSCLKYQNEYYLPVNSQGIAVHHRKGTTAMVIRSFNGELFSCIGEQVYALELLPEHKLSSKAFDLATIPELPKKKYIPPMNHPWKQASFEKYAKSQLHRKDVA
ncbi:ISNCY family transposase [Anaerocolumna sp. MB42-C2]|uniref:ISNCY family transposase n=1 Tax=Anaerocolumna sp. MB42-C2 TaxID=3070997 RepID=UPI0027DEE3C3|nr:ISNCY family transposase [Anaerocolumna sp. MB42-C2]WMJ85437.1 ISNCY family transposase [Anaerocolumna sp. MB42-C2]WMJ85838.1 ISNCY family transposase [Anaerocolumna sp. MB42-C2]WMJ86708.1 ISNCY family transposase [Anaerocolumna sp. MB42-C2]WMJ87142.1 ISNCY family transposase [Anaerocolumna sp. MB42-C2]WMJ87439.1 ISNCY family transposase [Anaerocolumna sp. MB42-C2]